MDSLGEEDSPIIYIQPPENVNETTDDESGDESVISEKVLHLPAEIKVSRKEATRSPIKLRLRKRMTNNSRCAQTVKKCVKRKLSASADTDCDSLAKKKTRVNCDNSDENHNQKNCDSMINNCKKMNNDPPKTTTSENNILKRKIISFSDTQNCDIDPQKRSKIGQCNSKCNTPKKKGDAKIGNKGSTTKNNGISWCTGGDSDVYQTEFGFTVTSTDCDNMNVVDYFELFFDNDLLQLIIHESSQYCKSKNWPDINLSKAELRTFFAILIISGYNSLPGKAMYWSRGKDLRNCAIYESMRRDRFDNIMKSLHFASDENLDKSDKYAKLRPVISHLQKKFMKHFVPIEPISHDEAMVEYFGNHSCKQSIRDKPIRFGYKVFCHNTPSGYLVAFDPYQGKTYQGDDEMEKLFGKSASSLLNILDKYPISKSEHPYHFYCDNYFTSIPLCKELKSRGYNCTGTIRANRLGNGCPLTDVKRFGKKQRGFTEVATATVSGEKVFVSRWKDNSVVTVASTRFAANPEGTVKRWCKADKKYVQVPIPHAIHNYNRNMGGTDRTDQNVNAYRVSIRGKKWWWPLFTWMLDISVQNAWQLARKQNPQLVQLQYRRDLANAYLSAHSQPPKTAGRKRKIDVLNESSSDSPRFDNIGHFVRNTINKKQRRCRGNGCKSKVRTECLKCDVGLCIPCFQSYHVA